MVEPLAVKKTIMLNDDIAALLNYLYDKNFFTSDGVTPWTISKIINYLAYHGCKQIVERSKGHPQYKEIMEEFVKFSKEFRW